MLATNAKVYYILLLTTSSASMSEMDSIALLVNNLADLGNTELNFVSDFMLDEQKGVR